ncbi:serine/threonine-protein kinase [Actinomadura craniellae]|nr:serine/threonine-protein kinase [Actinomadura craniellae]
MPNESPAGGRLLAGRYRLFTEVGRGGMGTVWEAHDEVLGRDVAVKEVILPHGLSDDERTIQYKRTFREARTAARLGHPGVVTVYDVVEEDGRPWIIMELIKSRSLDQVIKQDGPLEPRRAAEIGRQMLAALHAAHEAGVLHRDVKPSNVLLASGDRAVLTDFGIATAQGDVTLTQTGLVMGSPAYIAPERARGRKTGPASDLWSLGITLYAMVEGRSPYERSEPMAALVAIISEDPMPTANGGPLTPVIEGLLVKDPEQRMDAHQAGRLLDDIVREDSADTERTLVVGRLPESPAATEPEAGGTAVLGAGTGAAAHEVGPATLQGAAADPPAGTEPAPRPAAGGSGGGNDRLLPILAGAVILLLGIALAVVLLNDDGGNGKEAGAQEPGGRSPAASASAKRSPSASPSASASPDLPGDFRLHHDPTGFAVGIPEDWSGPERRQGGVFFYSPDRSVYIQIDQTTSPGASALKDWEGQEAARRNDGSFPGYDRVRLEPTGDRPPVPDTGNGDKSADWEFTWDGRSGRMRILNRGFVTNGRGYAILVSGPDDDWDDLMEELEPVYASFEPAR